MPDTAFWSCRWCAIVLCCWDVQGLLYTSQTSLQGGGWAGVFRGMVKKRGARCGETLQRSRYVGRKGESEGLIVMVLENWRHMSILGSLGATSQIWRAAEAPGGWNRSEKKPLYILCDWGWCSKGTLPVRGMWREVGKTDTASRGLFAPGLLVTWHRLCKRHR